MVGEGEVRGMRSNAEASLMGIGRGVAIILGATVVLLGLVWLNHFLTLGLLGVPARGWVYVTIARVGLMGAMFYAAVGVVLVSVADVRADLAALRARRGR